MSVMFQSGPKCPEDWQLKCKVVLELGSCFVLNDISPLWCSRVKICEQNQLPTNFTVD